MKKIYILGVIIVLIISLCPASVFACTVFSVTDGDQVLFGNNEDWLEKDVYIWFVPSAPNEYGRACVGFENAHPQGGINDQGLAIDWVAFKNATDDNLAPVLSTKDNFAGDINDGLLATCASVDDVIAFYEQYNDVNLGYATLYAADKTGSSLTITWDFVTDDMIVKQSDTQFNSLGYGSNKANDIFASDPCAQIESVLNMQKASIQPKLTLYSNTFDLRTGDIMLYYNQNFDEAAVMNLADELKKGPHIVEMASLFDGKSTVGSDVINPQSLLPLYMHIIIFALCALLLFCIAFHVLSMVKHRPLQKIEATAHLTGIFSGAIAVAVLCFMYFNWCFLVVYGFQILGIVPNVIAWMLVAATFGQLVLCIMSFFRQILKKRALYVILTVIILFITVEMFLNGLLP